MTPVDFVCWLRGFAAALGDRPPDADEWSDIKSRLAEAPPASYFFWYSGGSPSKAELGAMLARGQTVCEDQYKRAT